MRLNQLRFVRGNSLEPLRNGALRKLAKEYRLVHDSVSPYTTDSAIGDGVEIRVDLEGQDESSIVAYKAKDSPRAIELDRLDYYDPAEFWERIERPRKARRIILSKGSFYLLASKARVGVPLTHAAEMIAHDPSMGEFDKFTTQDSLTPDLGMGRLARFTGRKQFWKSEPMRYRLC